MLTRLVSKIEFSRLCGIDKSTITYQLQNKLAPAVIDNRVDANHELAAAYINKCLRKGKPGTYEGFKQVQPEEIIEAPELEKIAPKKKPKKKPAVATKEKRDLAPPNIMQLVDWTLGDILRVYGDTDSFTNFLKNMKTGLDIQKVFIKNQQEEKKILSFEVLTRGVIDPLQESILRILTDGKKTICKKIQTAFKSGKDINAIEAVYAKQMGDHFGSLIDKIEKTLLALENDD